MTTETSFSEKVDKNGQASARSLEKEAIEQQLLDAFAKEAGRSCWMDFRVNIRSMHGQTEHLASLASDMIIEERKKKVGCLER